MKRRAGSVLVTSPPPGAADAQRVRAHGGQPRRDTRVESLLTWAGSLAGHVIIAIVAFVVTWTVIARVVEEEAPVVTLLDFRAPNFDPVTAPPTPDATVKEDRAVEPAPPAAEIIHAIDRQSEVVPEEARASALGSLTVESGGRSATFAGLRASNARRIVYVVDASGSLVGTFPALARELATSLSQLDQRQSFAVIFFQRNEAVKVPPGTLLPATSENVRRAVAWFEQSVFPSGRSNPLAALEAAMALKPDLIFLLSAGVTGAGEYEIAADDLLRAIDRLNPSSSRSGRRRVRIQCIGFLDRASASVLEQVAAIHGGPDSYRFLSRDELGLAPGARGPDGAPAIE